MKKFAFFIPRLPSLALVFVLSVCATQDKPRDMTLPRFTKLEPFNPHRADFVCKHEADVTPPISAEAEALFQRALALDDHDLWPAQRDYVGMASLYEQAMKLGHWKAQFNLAGAYLWGTGVPQDIEKALALTEDLMRKGVPAAWDNIGTYYMGGVGPLEQDATVAYAFWQKAADMGSKAAQAYIGARLLASIDEGSYWANKSVGMKMLACAYSQGEGGAGFELGLEYAIVGPTDETTKKLALQYFHEAVKFGSEKAAIHLYVDFDDDTPETTNVAPGVDKARAERYSTIADALARNPELRFPNLDDVLPLPPAKLPGWDGSKETLINAARGAVPNPSSKPGPASLNQ